MKISYSFGMVDLLHFGHINAIKKAAEDSDLSIFGIVSDAASDAWFGSHVSNEEERRKVMESIRYVDEVWYQKTLDPLDNLRLLHTKYPDAVINLFVGHEWGSLSAKKFVESIGGKVVKIDYYDKLSPKQILETLNRNEIAPKPLNNNLISTKANTLNSLKGILTRSYIEDLYILTVGSYYSDSELVVLEIQNCFKSGYIVVRSSSNREDAFEESNAGHFVSVLKVDVSNKEEIKEAVEKVIASYGENPDKTEQVLVQRQTENVLTSGVIFTRDIQRNRPYYVINYEDGGSTDSVTSGTGGSSVYVSYRASKESILLKWRPLLEAVWELEEILSNVLLDIEFAITESKVVIFQVRPLAAAYKFGRQHSFELIENAKSDAVLKYQKEKRAGLVCWSDMAFWNPAEIIGDNPKNLDYSLYREIITKRAWDVGIAALGYRHVYEELMYKFGNKPYISIERAFEALLPNSIGDNLAKKLCDYYVAELKKDLSAHDKIEFEIVHNCFDFSLKNRLEVLRSRGFTNEEACLFYRELKRLTIDSIIKYDSILSDDLKDLTILEGIRLDTINIVKDCKDFRVIAKSIRTLLKATEEYGTVQFSRQARCAFIAKQIASSLVREGYISSEDYDNFMVSIKTVAADYEKDYRLVMTGGLPLDLFKNKYGHLRAGTYNIRSLRYDEMDNLFDNKEKCAKFLEKEVSSNVEALSNEFVGKNNNSEPVLKNAISKALNDCEITSVEPDVIVSFMRKSIEQREYFKFIFTKSLSFAIELIKRIGSLIGVEVKDLSYLEVSEIYASEFYTEKDSLKELWDLIINRRKELFRINSEIMLPEIITSERDFDFISSIASRPNFITEKKVVSDVVLLEENQNQDIEGKIVVIEKADPGYDWIFSKGIAGLITEYGGVASHMSIRCAEFSIPAAIGCGTNKYNYVSFSKRILLDCKHEKIEKVM